MFTESPTTKPVNNLPEDKRTTADQGQSKDKAANLATAFIESMPQALIGFLRGAEAVLDPNRAFLYVRVVVIERRINQSQKKLNKMAYCDDVRKYNYRLDELKKAVNRRYVQYFNFSSPEAGRYLSEQLNEIVKQIDEIEQLLDL